MDDKLFVSSLSSFHHGFSANGLGRQSLGNVIFEYISISAWNISSIYIDIYSGDASQLPHPHCHWRLALFYGHKTLQNGDVHEFPICIYTLQSVVYND